MTIPAKWNMDVPESGVPVLFNYKRSEGGPQGLFPDHGANIFLIPLDAVKINTNATTLDEWIHRNLQHDHSSSSIKQLPDLDPNPRSPRNIVEVWADFVRDEQDEEKQSEVNYYFTLNGAEFRLMLLYWKDDHQGKYFQSTAESLLRSLRSR